VRTGRLRGDVCSPDYDFLDPRLADFYDGITNVVSLQGWIHGLEAVTLQLSTAWHEVAIMKRLFPALPGMSEYADTLRGITRKSNDLLLTVVEDLSYVYSDGRENRWDPVKLEESRQQVLDDLITERDEFIYRHQDTLLTALRLDGAPLLVEESSRIAATA